MGSLGIEKQHLQAPPDDGTIQRLCAECEAQLAEKEERQAIQAKLTVGAAGDKYEQEADAVAQNLVVSQTERENQGQGDNFLRKFKYTG